MIEYTYIPPVTGKEAERIIEKAEYNERNLRGSQAPSKESLEASRRMFQHAGLFL